MDYLYEYFNNVDYPKVRLSTIIIYLIYFGLMWAVLGKMVQRAKKFPLGQGSSAGKITRANFLLLVGDTAMFVCWLMLFINYEWLNSIQFNKGMLSVIPVGILSTSVTMSLYYLFLYFFYKDKFKNGKWDLIGYVIIGLVIVRIILHFNPYNVWINMDATSSKNPNYSAWIRNAPLFLYGLLIVTLIFKHSTKAMRSSTDQAIIKSYKKLNLSMICLYASFIFYGLDIFLSHTIPNSLIWLTYTFKTFAYVGAAWFMLNSQFQTINKDVQQ